MLMEEPMHSSCTRVFPLLFALALGALGTGPVAGCTGQVEAPPGRDAGNPDAAAGEDAGDTGTGGDPDCSRLAVPDLAHVCPDGTAVGGVYVVKNRQCVLDFPCPTPVQTGCAQGAACIPGNQCGAGQKGVPVCATSCVCDASGHFQCNTVCDGVDDASAPVDADLVTDASACLGELPALCQICDGGAYGCAHFVVDDGTCQIAFCP